MWPSAYIFTLLLLARIKEKSTEEIWEQDLSKDIEIGASTKGYNRVGLRCGAETMTVNVQTVDDFSGVIYTQGSFYSGESPCFLNPDHGGNFTLVIPFDQCNTRSVDDRYRNVLVLQHDDELVTPGDAAFLLECDFSRPRDIAVAAELGEPREKRTRTRISLVDADPGRDEAKSFGYVESESGEVVFAPGSIVRARDEL